MGCQLIYDCLHITVPLDSSSGEQLEGKVLSLCTASGSYYIQPLWYRHICIKGPPLSNSIPFPMCSSLTPSVSYKKGRTTLKKTPKIYDCHNPGNQVIDWSSRKLDLYSRQGFSFFLLHKKKQNKTPQPSASPLYLLQLGNLRCLTVGDSCYLCLPCSHATERKKKEAMAQQGCKRTNLLKFSPEKKKKNNQEILGAK